MQSFDERLANSFKLFRFFHGLFHASQRSVFNNPKVILAVCPSMVSRVLFSVGWLKVEADETAFRQLLQRVRESQQV